MLAPTPASPESAGMSKQAFDRLEAHIKERYIDAGRFPGSQLLVYRRGKVVHSAVQGFADLERKAPVKDDTIFRIYSMTKPITSVAFMMLFEEGRVALDADRGPLAAYLRPDLWLPAALQCRCCLPRDENRRGGEGRRYAARGPR